MKTNTPKKSKDIPVTQEMLYEVRDELIHRMDSRFSGMDSRFASMDSRFASMDAKFANIDEKFEKVLSEIHRIGLLVEEQNSRNKYVLDGYEQIYRRQEFFEKSIDQRVSNVEAVVHELYPRK